MFGSFTSSTSSKIPHKSLDQLLIHNSDTWVKPIIGNKDLEKELALPEVNEASLAFKPWGVDRVSALIDQPQIEGHFQEIYAAMAGQATINEKLNALVYFESIIVNSNVSNRLINSAFVALLVKMLRSVKSPGVR